MTEALRSLAWERACADQFKQYRCRERAIHRFYVRLYVFIGYYLLGACFNQLMVDIAKYAIGRLRPHFIAICQPEGFSLPNVTACMTHAYITDYRCMGTDEYYIRDSHLSFFSGHAAFSFYAAWYITLYLQARIYRPLFSRVLLPTIQFTLFALAAACAYSRVSDYKHHWSDVIFGTICGSLIGIITAVFIAEVFKRREIPERNVTPTVVPTACGEQKCGHDTNVELGLLQQQQQSRSAYASRTNSSSVNDVFYSPVASPIERTAPISKHL
jgi:membrane-associated phospholipid phosphatase